MDALTISGSKIIPTINLNPDTGVFEISGKSVPGDAIAFYQPILHWVGEYTKAPQEITTINFRLDYFNTNSSKCLLDLFKRFETIHKMGHKVIFNWFYEKEYEDMKESGEDFNSLLELPITLIQV